MTRPDETEPGQAENASATRPCLSIRRASVSANANQPRFPNQESGGERAMLRPDPAATSATSTNR